MPPTMLPPMLPLAATFSIVARCPRSGRLGIAISTAIPAVGALCPFVRPGVGAVTTQSFVNPYLALDVLDRLAAGEGAAAALEAVVAADPDRGARQAGVVDAAGATAAWTGADCVPWAGHAEGDGFCVQGNMLTGPETVARMDDTFRNAAPDDLAERLMTTLEAGQAAGGDMRGKQSACLQVWGAEAYPEIDLRVDDHPAPVAALRRVLETARHQLAPFVASMPRRHGTPTPLSDAARADLLAAPAERPGPGRPGPGRPPDPETVRALAGLALDDARLAALHAAYAPIAAEIARLRELDLEDVHPAVVFRPEIGGR